MKFKFENPFKRKDPEQIRAERAEARKREIEEYENEQKERSERMKAWHEKNDAEKAKAEEWEANAGEYYKEKMAALKSFLENTPEEHLHEERVEELKNAVQKLEDNDNYSDLDKANRVKVLIQWHKLPIEW